MPTKNAASVVGKQLAIVFVAFLISGLTTVMFAALKVSDGVGLLSGAMLAFFLVDFGLTYLLLVAWHYIARDRIG